MCRHNRLKGTLSDAAPILWQHGAGALPEKGRSRSTSCFTAAIPRSRWATPGFYECVKYMTGNPTPIRRPRPLALDVMRYLNAACAKWTEKTNIFFSIYSSP